MCYGVFRSVWAEGGVSGLTHSTVFSVRACSTAGECSCTTCTLHVCSEVALCCMSHICVTGSVDVVTHEVTTLSVTQQRKQLGYQGQYSKMSHGAHAYIRYVIDHYQTNLTCHTPTHTLVNFRHNTLIVSYHHTSSDAEMVYLQACASVHSN